MHEFMALQGNGFVKGLQICYVGEHCKSELYHIGRKCVKEIDIVISICALVWKL